MKRLLMILAIVTLSGVISLPAMADRDRHRHGGYQPQGHHHSHHHERRADRGKHHRRHHAKAPHRYRHHRSAPRRVIEHHYYSTPRHRDYRREAHRREDHRRHERRRDYRGHTDIPLVTVGGYPVLRVQVNH